MSEARETPTPERTTTSPLGVGVQRQVMLHHGTALDVLALMPSASVDAVITDPPYGVGMGEWDRCDPAEALPEMGRVARDFVAFCGQMPSLVDWCAAARDLGWRFSEHVTWIKRAGTQCGRLTRGHEEVMVYAVGDRTDYHSTRGPFEDVKLPLLGVGGYTEESLDRYIKDLHARLDGKGTTRNKSTTTQSTYLGRMEGGATRISVRTANYTNVWSFLPPNHARRDGAYRHPTEKPVALMQRAVEMLTPPGGTALDPYMGSGTTGEACLLSGRTFIGVERDRTFFETAQKRLASRAPRLFDAA